MLRLWFSTLIFIQVAIASAMPANAQPPIESSVVRIAAFQRFPDLLNPWERTTSQQSFGSGVIIDGQKILTSSHLVNFSSWINVQPFRSSRQYQAKLLAIAPEVDLAVLTVEDPSFFEGRSALKLSSRLPKINQQVVTYGYPPPGESLRPTIGHVSRIEYTGLDFGGAALVIELDATSGPGLSGGPGVVGNEITGIMAMAVESETTGFLIAASEVKTFLKDMEDKQYDGKRTLPVLAQPILNPSLRTQLGMQPSDTGILVTQVYKDSVGLLPGDVVTKIGKYSIANDGQIELNQPNIQVNFQYLAEQLADQGKLSVTLIRDKKVREVRATVVHGRELGYLVPFLKDGLPSYFAWGPLVFSTAYEELFVGILYNRAAHDQGAFDVLQMLIETGSPLVTRKNEMGSVPGERLVYVVAAFPHETNQGYDLPIFQHVVGVNGVPIRNLRHCVELLRVANERRLRYVTIDLGSNIARQRLVFERESVLAATEAILDANGIRKQCSDDLLDTWESSN